MPNDILDLAKVVIGKLVEKIIDQMIDNNNLPQKKSDLDFNKNRGFTMFAPADSLRLREEQRRAALIENYKKDNHGKYKLGANYPKKFSSEEQKYNHEFYKNNNSALKSLHEESKKRKLS